jgi:surface protein
MSSLFNDARLFNSTLANWNVSNVTTMKHMFYTGRFNQNISNWDVSNVTDMSNMFEMSEFNQSISRWNVSNVTNMTRMFSGGNFNEPLPWNVMSPLWMKCSWMTKISIKTFLNGM